MRFIRLGTSAVLAVLVAACSSSSPSSSGPDDAGAIALVDVGVGEASAETGSSGSAPANDAKIVLNVPAAFTGTTRELDIVVTPTVPLAGPPAGILYQAEKPVVTPGEALTLHGDATGITGSFYVIAVLYMQGGGQFSPAPGVDYEAQSQTVVAFRGSAINLGTLSLSLAGDGGV